MNNLKKNSIFEQSRKQDRILYVILIVFLMSLILLAFFRFYISSVQNDSAEVFKVLNQMAVTILNSESSDDEEVVKLFEEYKAVINGFEVKSLSPSRLLIFSTDLMEPVYHNEQEKNEYRDYFREYASELRARFYKYLQILLSTVYILLALMSFLVVTLSFFYKKMKTSINESLTTFKNGIEIIDAHLNLEKPGTFHYNENAPEEVQILNKTIHRIHNDIELDQKIDQIESYGSIPEIMEKIASALEGLIPLDRIALAFSDNEGRITAESAYVKYKKVWLEPGYSENMSESSLFRLSCSNKGRIINNLPLYAENRKISKSTELILREGICSSITIPLNSNNRFNGFLFISSLETNAYKNFHLKIIQRLANRLKQRFFHEYHSQELIAETANAFVGLMSERDNETSGHISRMAHYSSIIARNLSRKDYSISPGFPREILWFAPLHDIGKIGVADSILLKKGPLSTDEFDEMKLHVEKGLKIIKGMNKRIGLIMNESTLKTAEDIIRGHHEKYDGSGYPAGLRGREIPLAGRIVAIADVFDALTSNRPYKKALSVDESLNIMKTEMVHSFDPYIFECFLDSMDDILKVYETDNTDR